MTGDTPQPLPTVSCSVNMHLGASTHLPSRLRLPFSHLRAPTLLLLQPLSAPLPCGGWASCTPPGDLLPNTSLPPVSKPAPPPVGPFPQTPRELRVIDVCASGLEQELPWAPREAGSCAGVYGAGLCPRAHVGRPSLCQGACEQQGRLPPCQPPPTQGNTGCSRSCLSSWLIVPPLHTDKLGDFG